MKFKKIAAVVSAAAVMLALAGCATKEDNGVYVDKDGNISINESKFEDHVNSVFGGEDTNESSKAENAAPEVKPIEMSDEIKNAALNSGLVQYNNDIFRRGGYITVADFVEQWKDKYDITYKDGTYEERKDYLLEYGTRETIFEKYYGSVGEAWAKRDSHEGKRYSLTLKPKSGNGKSLLAYVVNATSPDEKITLDKAIVAEIAPFENDYSAVNPEWFPMGVNGNKPSEKYESENKNYNVNNLSEMLEAKGLKKNAEFDRGLTTLLPTLKDEDNWYTYWTRKAYGSYIECYVLGEENLFGSKPLYYYQFNIDSNTDKVKYANCTLEYFVKE